MKQFFSFCLFAGLLILIIPALTFLGTSAPKKEPDKTQPYNHEQLTKKEYKENNFYLVTNHITGEIMKISPLEYIKGVVASEMPALYEQEALKSQAVSAHTYAMVQLDTYNSVLSTDPAKCQGYLSPSERKAFWGEHYDEYEKKLTDAVTPVINKVITVDKKPILAAFHAISSGQTESAGTIWARDIPYLVPVQSIDDKSAPEYETTVTLAPTEIAKVLLGKYPEIKFNKDKSKWFSDIQKTSSGTVTKIKIGNIEATGNELREILSLRSAAFNVSYENEQFNFTVYGYGHGVGMSQFGANQMAKSGSSFEEILTHYYTGVEISDIK